MIPMILAAAAVGLVVYHIACVGREVGGLITPFTLCRAVGRTMAIGAALSFVLYSLYLQLTP